MAMRRRKCQSKPDEILVVENLANSLNLPDEIERRLVQWIVRRLDRNINKKCKTINENTTLQILMDLAKFVHEAVKKIVPQEQPEFPRLQCSAHCWRRKSLENIKTLVKMKWKLRKLISMVRNSPRRRTPLPKASDQDMELQKIANQKRKIKNVVLKCAQRRVSFRKPLASILLDVPDFVFQLSDFKSFKTLNDLMTELTKGVDKYIRTTGATYLKALNEFERILNDEMKRKPDKPPRKYSTEDIRTVCRTLQQLYWPRVISAVNNVLTAVCSRVKVLGEASWKYTISRAQLNPDEASVFDNFIKLFKAFEEDVWTVDSILIFKDTVDVPRYDITSEIHRCITSLNHNINLDYIQLNLYYQELVDKCQYILDPDLPSLNSEEEEFDIEKLLGISAAIEPSTIRIMDTIPYFYNFKIYRFDNKLLRDTILKKSQVIKENVSSYIRKCVQNKYLSLERWMEESRIISNQTIKTGDEFAVAHVKVVQMSTDGLEELVTGIKNMTSAIFASLECDPNTSKEIESIVNLYNEIDELKTVWKESLSGLEDVKFRIEEELLKIPQRIEEEIDHFYKYNIHAFTEVNQYSKIGDIQLYMRGVKAWLQKQLDTVKDLHSAQAALKSPKALIPALDEIKMFIDIFDKLVNFLRDWSTRYNIVMYGPVRKLNMDELEKDMEDTYRNLILFQKYFMSHIKTGNVENRRFKYDTKYSSSESEGEEEDVGKKRKKLCTPLLLIQEAVEQVRHLKSIQTVLAILTNKNMEMKHWEQMSEISGKNMVPFVSSSLHDYLEMGIAEYVDMFDAISTTATRELLLKNAFEKMRLEWTDICLNLMWSPKVEKDILGSVDDVQTLLDDHIVKTLSMKGSAYVRPIEAEVTAWYKFLTRTQETIEEWGKVQVQWMYYMPIFSSADIVAQMQNEGRLFFEVNDDYLKILREQVVEKKLARLVFNDMDLLPLLKDCLKKFEVIDAGVTAYLEKKRLYFARFFFLSNEDMLEILSETKDPLRVQPHLRKCFEGIDKLGFSKDLEIYSMFSAEREEVPFSARIKSKEAGGMVEKWLVQVEDMMVMSVRDTIEHSLNAYTIKGRKEWIQVWPGQVVLCGTQIAWTLEVTMCFETEQLRVLKRYHECLGKQLNRVIKLVRGELSEQARTTLGALVVLDVHAMDVTAELHQKGVVDVSDFQWLAQLRYYWIDGNVKAKLTNATVKYAYEYLGNTGRLVITPLTDRCYRTLIGAYNLHLNGAPEGPAGTGKTETTKDLAKAIAVQCVVFNCSDGLNYKAMGKFFKGLASSGAWACFDEFNRIDIEVLSVVAQQILCIVQAVRNHLKIFLFEGTVLNLNPACYVCITMNPGYAGRSELPDNLKVLFRTVAMMVPDYALIGEISLYSCGFLEARALSVKIVTTYKLCSEQLSSQSHYDYGMRAVKTVLSAAKNLKIEFPNELEEILLLRSIVDVNLPKFLKHDVVLFNGIISDLFPGVKLPPPSYDELLECAREVCKIRNLQPRDYFFEKVIQTYETMIVRHGFMLVGDPFSGKSSALIVLSEAMTARKKKYNRGCITKFQTLNPKSVSMGELYGESDLVSNEWKDGIIAEVYRGFAREDTPDRKWVVFDGPVDAVWIENMNTVLDDNKKLCLNSGEVIQMTPPMSMIFEVMDLIQASPATVSRCGMIYLESATLGWRPIAESWNSTLPQSWFGEDPERVLRLLDWLIPPSLDFILRNCKKLCDAGVTNAVRTTLYLFEATFKNASANVEEGFPYFANWLHATVLTSVIWGIAGTLDHKSRQLYDEFIRNIWDHQIGYPVDGEPIEVQLPLEGIIESNIFVYYGKGRWVYLPNKLSSVEDAGGIIIETVESIKYMSLMELLCKFKKPFILTGPTGTGKTVYFQKLLMTGLDLELYIPSFLAFTASISAKFTQELIISKLLKRNRTTYGPPYGTTAVIFIDDINMPAKEIYGAQPPLELLRQFFDYKYWYELNKKIFLEDMLIVAAMGLPGGSRQEVSARILRHFALLGINGYSEASVTRIYNAVLWAGMRKNGFTAEFMPQVNALVLATLAIYSGAMANLLPTPAKCHYLFNLRDFHRVIQGTLLVRKESVTEKKFLYRLWVHEILRVFYDRLISQSDKDWLFYAIKETLRDVMKETFEMLFSDLSEAGKEITELDLHKLIFTNLFDLDADEDKKYEEIASMEEFTELAVGFLETYNTMHKSKMNVVLFSYALHHLARIARILSTSGGSGLLVGVSGSGRQSMTKLAASIYEMILFQPEITANYGLEEWRGDLKNILKDSGGRNRQVVFLFSDTQIKEEYFLQDVDSLLNTGEVPNIFPLDELSEINEMGRVAAQAGDKNANITDFVAFATFVKKCKENLHLMLAFSPIGNAFRLRARMYPALINCCTIDWFFENIEGLARISPGSPDIQSDEFPSVFHETVLRLIYPDWPADSLECVADKYLEAVDIKSEIKSSLVSAFKQVHLTASSCADNYFKSTGRKMYVTSASYVEFIKCYTALVQKTEERLSESKDRYIGGLDKLLFAARQVESMQRDLEALQPQLESAAKETTEMLERIASETVEVKKTSDQVKQDEIVANKQAVEAEALSNECKADLAVAQPILENAIAALNTLTPQDITMVKAMKNPPSTVKLVLEAVCVMLDIKPARVPDPSTGKMVLDYWRPSVQLLSDMSFLKVLMDYDKDNISPIVMKTIRSKYLNHPDFQPEIVAKASSAAKGLCLWIHALDKYDEIIKIVAPKIERLKLAEAQYAKVKAELDAKRALLKSLEEKLAALQKRLDEALARKAKLTEDILTCSRKLEKAKQIIGSLGGEQKRWGETADKLQEQINNIPGDILISCGIIGYLTPLSLNYRVEVIKDWMGLVKEKKIPITLDYTLRSILGSEVAIQAWVIGGLPNDEFSIDNAVVMDSTLKWSLLIDPQGQGNKWLKTVYRNEIRVIRLSQKTSVYMKSAAVCVEMGYLLLLENIGESLDPVLNALIKQEYFVQGKKKLLPIGENVVEVHNNFKFCITTKLRNPHFMPEIFNNLTVINFALTEEGLSDQLLAIVVAQERPELDEERQALVEESAINQKTLEMAEKRILFLLSTTKDLLEDEETVNTLEESKKLAVTINKKEVEALETRNRIEETRLKYVPLAEHCASLYYTIDLQSIDPMYQFSLAWFIKIYLQSIHSSEKAAMVENRLSNIREVFNINLYRNVVRSLFSKDKTLYSFIFATTIMKKNKLISNKEMDFLLTGGVGLDNPVANPSSWLPNKSWDEICRVIELPKFKNLKAHFEGNLRIWEKFFYIPTPSKEDIPPPWREELSAFQILILVRIMRPDQLLPIILNFVSSEIGSEFVRPPPFNLKECYLASSQFTPLIFILSPGSDPMQSLLDLSKEYGQDRTFESISLGQGQGPIAEGMITKAIADEGWVALQNCHLMTSWMPKLEQICESLSYRTDLPAGFRLWLTSYPSDKFPITILEDGIKMINEAPTGLKNSLLRTYNTEPVNNDKFYNSCSKAGKEAIFRRLLLGISFFHAVVIERCRYGPIGWNIPYGFNESDYLISIQQLEKFVKKYSYIPFAAVLYLTGECNYGGRVTDNWDRRALNTLLDQYVCREIIYSEDYSLIQGDPVYRLPLGHHRDVVLSFVQSMPDMIPPGLYGLHNNAEITRNILSTRTFINSLQLISGGGSSGGEGDTDQLIFTVADNILIKLPSDYDVKAAMVRYPVDYKESMNTVLSQEMERFNRLTKIIRNSLIGLKKAIKGEVVMDKDLETLANSLLVSKIPAIWAKFSFPSLKPLGSYIKNLLDRLEFLQKWYTEGKPPNFWLSGFFFTHAFLSGILQNYARKYTIEIDKLTFDFEVLKTTSFLPEDGVVIYGMFLDGARWDRKKHMLAEQMPKVLSDELPHVWVKPVGVHELDGRGRYVSPVYRTSERKGVLSTTGHSTNYVLPIFLETPVSPEHWIKRGVALLLDLDD